jgi:hypothetical protein
MYESDRSESKYKLSENTVVNDPVVGLVSPVARESPESSESPKAVKSCRIIVTNRRHAYSRPVSRLVEA